MATTVASADLKIMIREVISLNGNSYDSVNMKILPNIKEVTKRIITVPTASIDDNSTAEGVAVFSPTDTLQTGPYAETDVRYIRITNLDDANHVILQLHNDRENVTAIKLDYGHSFMYAFDNESGSKDTLQSSANLLTHTNNAVTFVSGSAGATCEADPKIRVGSNIESTFISGSITDIRTIITTGSFVRNADPGATGNVNSVGAVTAFSMSAEATADQSNVEAKFSVGLQDLAYIYAVADNRAVSASNVDLEVFVASE